MRPKTKQTTLFATQFAIWSVLLTLCVSSGYAQGTSGSRMPVGARYANALSGMDSLDVIQSQAAPAPRVRLQAETIAVRDLLVPAAAIKEFKRSEKAVHSGNFESAAEHLKKALEIDPTFVQAHNNLGASYIQLNQYEGAVTEFRKAIDLNTKMQEPYRNLGLSLFLLHRFPEAELAARQAMQLGPQRGPARYTLGRILAAEGSSSAEAEQLLRGSLGEFPEARLPLAQVFLNKGAPELAATELRTYLRTSKTDQAKRQAVEQWLSRITQSKAVDSGSGAKNGSGSLR
jgi:tetratricopeptide (TPR) repeat protein